MDRARAERGRAAAAAERRPPSRPRDSDAGAGQGDSDVGRGRDGEPSGLACCGRRTPNGRALPVGTWRRPEKSRSHPRKCGGYGSLPRADADCDHERQTDVWRC